MTCFTPGSGIAPRRAPDRGRPRGWPLSSYLELGALPSAVPCARLHTRQVLWEWGLSSVIEAAELIVSELVTNAQRASAGLTGSRYDGRWAPGTPPIRLWLNTDHELLLIQVWDGDDRLPEPRGLDPESESGRGLLLVGSLSTDWGACVLEGSTGKVVWASLSQEVPCNPSPAGLPRGSS